MNAPYSVCKSGVIALSETLYNELRHDKLPVNASVLCPGTVRTNMRENSNKLVPSGGPVTSHPHGNLPDELTPQQVADMVLDAIRNDRFWMLTHRRYTRTSNGAPKASSRRIKLSAQTDNAQASLPLPRPQLTLLSSSSKEERSGASMQRAVSSQSIGSLYERSYRFCMASMAGMIRSSSSWVRWVRS